MEYYVQELLIFVVICFFRRKVTDFALKNAKQKGPLNIQYRFQRWNYMEQNVRNYRYFLYVTINI